MYVFATYQSILKSVLPIFKQGTHHEEIVPQCLSSEETKNKVVSFLEKVFTLYRIRRMVSLTVLDLATLSAMVVVSPGGLSAAHARTHACSWEHVPWCPGTQTPGVTPPGAAGHPQRTLTSVSGVAGPRGPCFPPGCGRDPGTALLRRQRPDPTSQVGPFSGCSYSENPATRVRLPPPTLRLPPPTQASCDTSTGQLGGEVGLSRAVCAPPLENTWRLPGALRVPASLTRAAGPGRVACRSRRAQWLCRPRLCGLWQTGLVGETAAARVERVKQEKGVFCKAPAWVTSGGARSSSPQVRAAARPRPRFRSGGSALVT